MKPKFTLVLGKYVVTDAEGKTVGTYVSKYEAEDHTTALVDQWRGRSAVTREECPLKERYMYVVKELDDNNRIIRTLDFGVGPRTKSEVREAYHKFKEEEQEQPRKIRLLIKIATEAERGKK